MKLLALATPLLVLGLILLLQRMEAWCAPVPRAAGDRPVRPRDGPTPSTRRSAMPTSTSASTATTTELDVAEPLLRDPPTPPGDVDPVEDGATLEDLVEATREGRSSGVPSTHAG